MNDQGWNTPGGSNDQGNVGPQGAPPPPQQMGVNQSFGQNQPAVPGTPPGQQGYSASQTAGNDPLEPNIASGVSYIFGWVSGLIVFLTHKNLEARFHAVQSIIFTGILSLLGVFVEIFDLVFGDLIGFIFAIVSIFVYLGMLVGVIILIIAGFQGKHLKVPVIGDMAEKYAQK